MSYTLSLEPILGMITPYSLHTIKELQRLIEAYQDEIAFQALKILVKQFAMGFTSVIQGFWQFSNAISKLPHGLEYQTEVKKLFILAKVYNCEQLFINK
jgi:hypothetical protein